MTVVWQIGAHILVTLVAVVGVAVRMEHRLTKIETDVSWLKANQKCGEKGDQKSEDHCEVDQA